MRDPADHGTSRLVNAPKVVFLDEMTTGLDPSSRRLAWSLIERVRDSGTTVVLVAHFMDEAEHLCDRVCIIDDQRVIAAGTPAELVAGSPRHGDVTAARAPDARVLPGAAAHRAAGAGRCVRRRAVEPGRDLVGASIAYDFERPRSIPAVAGTFVRAIPASRLER